MRVVAIGMVRNEIDIVEAFVRHALAQFDHLVVLDNGSHDGTLDVLRSLQREGLALDVVEDTELGKRQSERTTRLMREHAVARQCADWILPIDADEFPVLGPGGLGEPESSGCLPISIPWRSYVPDVSDDASERNPVLRIRYRLRTEGWRWVKVAIPRGLAEQPGAGIGEGNHSFHIGEREVETRASEGCFLGHFPIRGPGQYQAKVAIGYLNRILVRDRQSDWGFQYRGPFEQLKVEPSKVAAEYREVARRYSLPGGASGDGETILDPFAYLGGALKYTPAFDDSDYPISALAVLGETLARRCAAYEAAIDAAGQRDVARVEAVQDQLYRQLYAKDDLIRRGQDALRDVRRAAAEKEAELRGALESADRSIREYIAGAERVLDSERGARRLLAAVERELDAVRRSWTLRIGSAVVWPARRLRRLIRGKEDGAGCLTPTRGPEE